MVMKRCVYEGGEIMTQGLRDGSKRMLLLLLVFKLIEAGNKSERKIIKMA